MKVRVQLTINIELDTQVARLKASFLEIESQLKSIRLKALGNREISVKEVQFYCNRYTQ
jgi:hypothetical protein